MAQPLNVSKVPSVMPIALIPGLGHLVVRRKKRAFHLLGFFTAMMAASLTVARTSPFGVLSANRACSVEGDI